MDESALPVRAAPSLLRHRARGSPPVRSDVSCGPPRNPPPASETRPVQQRSGREDLTHPDPHYSRLGVLVFELVGPPFCRYGLRGGGGCGEAAHELARRGRRAPRPSSKATTVSGNSGLRGGMGRFRDGSPATGHGKRGAVARGPGQPDRWLLSSDMVDTVRESGEQSAAARAGTRGAGARRHSPALPVGPSRRRRLSARLNSSSGTLSVAGGWPERRSQ